MVSFLKKRKTLRAIKKFFRAANYLTVAQIYLRDNFLLNQPLRAENIKPRILGHWGTCPGINFVHAHLNSLICDSNQKTMFIVGPGHGFPAVQANLFLDGTLHKFYGKEYARDKTGIENISKLFSVPYGFPSHSSPETPGVIVEGGELGYALSVAFGAVLDKPDTLAVALIGDGEAETGPTATSWHLSKFLTKNDGAVLPILHLNSYKISGPTIFGRMSDADLQKLFEGYGYQPLFVDHNKLGDDGIHDKMYETLRTSLRNISAIRSFDDGSFQKYPMIILRTPKGWTGPEKFAGKKVAGNHLSHQVIFNNLHHNKKQLGSLDDWLRSYNFSELFGVDSGFDKDLLSLIPRDVVRMGDRHDVHAGARPLRLPSVSSILQSSQKHSYNSMKCLGVFLSALAKKNPRHFRFFSPDETYSNRLDQIFRATKRAWTLPIYDWDDDLHNRGRVIEMLSEHALTGAMQGYILTGGSALLATYGAFAQIISSMVDQYTKFLQIARNVKWRRPVAAMNFILTSSLWQQEHNGFSHQNPGFVHDMLSRHTNFIEVFFPSDAYTSVHTASILFKEKSKVNVVCVGKHDMPLLLSQTEAKKQAQNGIMIWEKYSDAGVPDIVLGASGDYMSGEVVMASKILRQLLPKLNIRLVNISSFTGAGIGRSGGELTNHSFKKYFPPSIPIVYNFYGYTETAEGVFFNYNTTQKQLSVHGYTEQGSTTTPFDMLVRNQADRYSLVKSVAQKLAQYNRLDTKIAHEIQNKMNAILAQHGRYIRKHMVDVPPIASINLD